MSVTIDNGAGTVLSLPAQGSLVWADERGWQDVVQTVTYCFGGACVVQESAPMQAGQPMTLTGGELFAWAPRSAVDALIALLAPAGSQHTLTFDIGTASARAYTVTARRSDGPSVQARPLPLVDDSGMADETDDSLYVIDAVRLLILAGPL